MALIAFLALAMAIQQDGLELALPLLGAFALGAQRLLPLLQQVYQSWATLRGASKTVDHVLALLEQPLPRHVKEPPPPPLPYYRDIELRDVGHQYNPGGPWVLRHISFRITKGSRVGVKGTTGSGKSTLLDIVMGLLSPTTGQVLVDGAPVTATNQRAWQAHIAHVPQSIYLADASVAENIAFGTPSAQIDLERVREAAGRAQIAKTIEALPNGYDTLVGERGVQLSGGQRQRIGIARALYKRADVLVFDEATSALDTKTEAEVMGAIQSLDRELTIFLIAHRLSTLEGCDVTVDLKV
jgi:ATP-binding cassette subfamily B protein